MNFDKLTILYLVLILILGGIGGFIIFNFNGIAEYLFIIPASLILLIIGLFYDKKIKK